MIGRFLFFVLLQALAGLAGWHIAHEFIANELNFAWAGALWGVLLTGWAWFLADKVRGGRILNWLRQGDYREPPFGSGLWGGQWGEAADRTRRLVRNLTQQTQDSDARLQDFLAAIQASPHGVVLLDPQGRIEWCNPTATSHFGFDPTRDLAQHIGNLVRNPAFTAYCASGDVSQEVTLEGSRSTFARPVTISAQLHPYGAGRQLLLSRDITALEQAEVMRRDFVANVSHEIRTPLTVLSGFVETLQTLPLDEEERTRYLAMMAVQSQRMQSLVSDLLTLSRLEGSPLPSMQEWTPLSTLMAQCEQEARALSAALTVESVALGKPQHIHFASPPAVSVAGSSSEWLSAFSNLINNAVRYTPADGVIEVTWDHVLDEPHAGGNGTSRWVFSVQDTGPGIAPEHLPRLSERFYRVDRSRSRETGGTGLGLAIVKHVLQRHGAVLSIRSTLGQGSRFSVALPGERVR